MNMSIVATLQAMIEHRHTHHIDISHIGGVAYRHIHTYTTPSYKGVCVGGLLYGGCVYAKVGCVVCVWHMLM